MQENHSNKSDEETEYSLPTNNLEGLQSVILENPLLHDKLGRGENLSASNEENTNNGAGSCGGNGRFNGCGLFFEESTGEANNSHTKDNNKEGKPLEGTKMALEEEDAENTNEEDKGSTGHLVDFRY